MRLMLGPLAASGCLWIGPEDHAERKALVAIDLAEVSLAPDVWSACMPPSASLAVRALVSPSSPELPFQGWVALPERRVPLGEQPALAMGAHGELAFSFLPADLWPPCPEGCTLPFRFGVSRVGLEQGLDLTLEVLPEQTPYLVDARLLDSAGAPVSLDRVERQPDPTHAVSVAQYPALVMELSDRHLLAGIGGSVEVWACPEGLQPPDELCVVQPADPSLEDTLASDLAFRADTEPLGEATCAAIQQERWPAGAGGELFAVVTGHTCGTVAPIPLAAEPLRFVIADCDADGSPAPEDCADTDPDSFPGQSETPYDGVDSDCSGGSDFDQDGDGSEYPTDCDDTDGTTFPGALEVCDGHDNDCLLDGEPSGATLYSAAGASNHDLQQALSLAEDGDTVTICPGTYAGPFVTGAIALRGVGSGVVLQGGAGAVLTLGDALQPAGVASVQGVVLQGGQGTDGGGLDARGVAQLVVEDCALQGNDAARGGGLAAGGLVTLRRTTLSGNTAAEGAGLWASPDTELVLEEVTVSGNTAELYGGGLFLDDAVVEADALTRIELNLAGQQGGGLWATADLELYGGTFQSNEAPYGGALALVRERGSPEWWLEDLLVEDHTAPGIVEGGGIWASGSGSLVISGALLARNAASSRGGGLYAVSDGEPVEVTLLEVDLEQNTAQDGGGLATDNAVLGAGVGVWSGNVAGRGGALWGASTAAVLGVPGYGLTITGNTASAEGGALWLGPSDYTSALLAYDSLISDNLSGDAGGLYLETGEHELIDLIIEQNSGSTAGGLLVSGGAQVVLSGALLLSGNSPNGGRLVDDSIEACSSVTVDDPLENTTLDTQGSSTSCFLLSPTGPPSPCGC